MEPSSLLLLALLGGWTVLDEIAVGQFLIARPLVASTLAGAIMGNAGAGFLAGVLLELLHLSQLPTGAVELPEPGPGAVVAGAMASLPAFGGSPGALALGVSAGALLSLLGGRLRVWHRRSTERRVGEGRQAGLGWNALLVRSLALQGGRGIVLTIVGLFGALGFGRLAVPVWPLPWPATLALLGVAGLQGVGGLIRATAVRGPRGLGLLSFGTGVGLLLGWLGLWEIRP
jgi:mannose/fructose/N-acetylgalactosamine-specific phosphotransferase system component IIC